MFVFFPLTLGGYYLLDRRFRNVFLLIASLGFYAWGEPKFVFIMIASILINYLYALGIDKFREKRNLSKTLLTLMVVTNVAIFFVFKYLGFAIQNINTITGQSIAIPQIALPIGISFFTFQSMSYVIDVYRENGKVQKNPLNLGLYIAFFPQLIAGPIVRYETIAEQIDNRKENWADFCRGLERFVTGMGKKVLLSNSLAIVADRSFNYIGDNDVSVLMAWLGAVCYTLQIYYDFSGYSDMAIGLGKMFGFQFEENFNYPYIASSVTDFWRRWHISLSTWFRDYVYIPLGGSRVKPARHIFNLFVVWSLTGVWHGASWNFIWWGWFYFILLVFEKLTGIPEKMNSKAVKIVYRVFTIIMVTLGWVLFRAENLSQALLYMQKMFGVVGNHLVDDKAIYILADNRVVLIVSIICSTPIIKRIAKILVNKNMEVLVDILKYLLLSIIFILCLCSIVVSTYNPFIYFNF